MTPKSENRSGFHWEIPGDGSNPLTKVHECKPQIVRLTIRKT